MQTERVQDDMQCGALHGKGPTQGTALSLRRPETLSGGLTQCGMGLCLERTMHGSAPAALVHVLLAGTGSAHVGWP